MNFNVNIFIYSKDNKINEIILADEWTNDFMFNNIIYQIKYNNKKPRINKLNENKEIKLIIIKIHDFENCSINFFCYF